MCGLKPSGRRDLALFVSDRPASVAVLATQNRFAAPPVLITRAHARSGRAQAFVVNSGNANAATGAQGRQDALEMCTLVARAIGVTPRLVLVNSTGVIGVPLDMGKIRRGIEALVSQLDPAGLNDAAEAILTTDRRPKRTTRVWRQGGRQVRLMACAKGVGMIHPNMATMIAAVFTDAAISPALLRRALRLAADQSFHGLTVDGDTSTNDMAVAFANGASGAPAITRATSSAFKDFVAAMTSACQDLVHAIAADGEGASRVAVIRVSGARSAAEARALARAVGSSSLVKTAIHGADPNWGRICMALGNAGVPVDPSRVSVSVQGLRLFVKGRPRPFDRRRASQAMRADTVRIDIHVARGRAGATCWASSLTEEYVRFNSAYTT